jgi:hypothetical protein
VIFVCISVAVTPLAFAQTPAVASAPSSLPQIDGSVRVHYLLSENLGPLSIADTVAFAALDTAVNTPKEYKTHWDGFGMRIGLITANYALKSTMEVGMGGLWGEDPRYLRTEGTRLGGRVGHVIKMTFMARDRNGKTMPAYSRYFAYPASSFIENAWEPHSQNSTGNAVTRIGLGFLSKLGENAWLEFIAPRR